MQNLHFRGLVTHKMLKAIAVIIFVLTTVSCIGTAYYYEVPLWQRPMRVSGAPSTVELSMGRNATVSPMTIDVVAPRVLRVDHVIEEMMAPAVATSWPSIFFWSLTTLTERILVLFVTLLASPYCYTGYLLITRAYNTTWPDWSPLCWNALLGLCRPVRWSYFRLTPFWLATLSIDLWFPMEDVSVPGRDLPNTAMRTLTLWVEEGYVWANFAQRDVYSVRKRLSHLLRSYVDLPVANSEFFLNNARYVMKTWNQVMHEPKSDNPHALGALIRSNGTLFMERLCFSREGFWLRYDVQTNPGNNAGDGSSLVFDPVDMHVAGGQTLNDLLRHPRFANQVVERDGHRFIGNRPIDDLDYLGVVLTMVDVDFHANMPYWLNLGLPIVLYTVLPTAAATAADKSSHFYFEGDQMVYNAHMGFATKHMLWNYGPDYCLSEWKGRVSCNRTLYYTMPNSRACVIMVPQWQISASKSWLAVAADRHHLARYHFNHPGDGNLWTAFRFWDSTGLYVTVAAAGPDSRSVTVPWESFSEVVDTYRVLGGSRVPEHTVNALAGDHAYLLTRYAADYCKYHHVLETIHRGIDHMPAGWTYVTRDLGTTCAASDNPCSVCVPVTERGPNEPEGYKLGDHNEHVLKSTVTKIGQSVFVDKVDASLPAVAPVRDRQAAGVAIEERVLKPQQAAAATASKEALAYLPEFVEVLMRRLPKIDPLSPEEVLKRLRPCKREMTFNGMRDCLGPHSRRTRGFMKAEAYTEAKAPRIITPLHPTLQARMYAFSYALQDALHDQPWYAFGRKLPELANHLATLTRNALYVVETDYSKFDGTVSEVARAVERAVYHAYFPKHVAVIDQLLDAGHNIRVQLNGQTYKSGFSRSSGSPDTSLMNSVLNLYAMYITFGPAAFYKSVVGGDDGVYVVSKSRGDVIEQGDCPGLRRASAALGFNIKCVVRKPNETFGFLARLFKFGDPNSICQPLRLLPKLHVIGAPNVPKKYQESRLRLKLQACLDSDGNTPIVGDLIRQQLAKLSGPALKVPDVYMSDFWWRDLMATLGPWPNVKQPWMEDVVREYVEPNGNLVELIKAKPPLVKPTKHVMVPPGRAKSVTVRPRPTIPAKPKPVNNHLKPPERPADAVKDGSKPVQNTVVTAATQVLRTETGIRATIRRRTPKSPMASSIRI